VKVAVMKRRSTFPAALLLGTPILLCAARADAAGIGVQFGLHGHAIPRAVAGGFRPRVGTDAGTRAPSQMNSNTRNIRLDITGESAATRSRK
jgi:hypothetical protein